MALPFMLDSLIYTGGHAYSEKHVPRDLLEVFTASPPIIHTAMGKSQTPVTT